jgi:uncharacterized membrane protein YccF (DUF307 family)
VSLLGNLIWIVFGGFEMFLAYLLAGLGLCVTIIGIPFGIQLIKLSLLALWPFGKVVAHSSQQAGCASGLLNVLWMITGGLVLAIGHALFGLVFAITIVGIPFARQHFKLAALAFAPFGLEIRTGW